jgi:hypothetical protein
LSILSLRHLADNHCSGPQGSIQIKVIRGDLSEATYPSPYSLQVVKFDIIDENGDGINEPGEHLLVHNIRVKNAGGMPSPEARSIHLLIQGTQFLEPKALEPLELPRSIQPGQEVDVPGVLRAYIRNEWSEKPLGESLNYVDNVQLLAIFHERLNRPIPNFCGRTQIAIRYPLRLDPPTYLDCVAKGDRVRFKWVVSGFLSECQNRTKLTVVRSTTTPKNRTALTGFSKESRRLGSLIHVVSSNLHLLPMISQRKPQMKFPRLSQTV